MPLEVAMAQVHIITVFQFPTNLRQQISHSSATRVQSQTLTLRKLHVLCTVYLLRDSVAILDLPKFPYVFLTVHS